MTHFLACMFTLLQICLTPSLAILSPPKNLTVGLLDFKATAEWLPGKGNPPDSRYTLEFITARKMSGGKWNCSPHCTNIAILKCELTFNLQPELHWNYFVRVKTTLKRARSNWTTTLKSFQPYGDTHLSSPDVKISTEQKSIKINFSHCLELKPEIKPLEYLLYIFENSPAGESKFVALISTSESPYIFRDVPSGKNYCVSVSASHQQALKNNNFNTNKCIFLLDSTRSFMLVCIVAILLIIFSTGIFLSFGCFYHMRHKNKNLHIPKHLVCTSILLFIKLCVCPNLTLHYLIFLDITLPRCLIFLYTVYIYYMFTTLYNNTVFVCPLQIVFPGYKWVLKPILEEYQPITVTPPKTATNTEGHFSSWEEDSKDGSLFYQPTSVANVIPPEQAEEADTSNQCYKYTIANDMEDSEENENVISEKIEENMHPGSESGSSCACNLNHLRSSRILQTVIMNTFVNSETIRYYAEETLSCSSGNSCEREVPAEDEEEEDDFFLPDFSDSGYEPRQKYL
uniref:Fibronectin type-III domain-containing protein n=1 Tax=Sinocyclocheilus anshuiensis TaxID=1608454 RepID=A0A671SEE5_9TELE